MKEVKGTKAYKVVEVRTRFGSNALIYRRKYGHNSLEELCKEYPGLKRYFPQYKKGATVRAVPKSAGIFCFGRLIDAQKFVVGYEDKAEIIRVKGFTKVRKPMMLSGCGIAPDKLVRMDESQYYPITLSSYSGIVCYRSVFVEE